MVRRAGSRWAEGALVITFGEDLFPKCCGTLEKQLLCGCVCVARVDRLLLFYLHADCSVLVIIEMKAPLTVKSLTLYLKEKKKHFQNLNNKPSTLRFKINLKSRFSATRFTQEEYDLLDKTLFDQAHVLTMKCKIRFQ